MPKIVAVIGRGIQGQMFVREALSCGYHVLLFGSVSKNDCASIAASGVQCQKGLLVARDPIFKAKLRGHNTLSSLIDSSQGVRSIKGVYEPCFDRETYQKRKKRIFRRQFSSMMASRIIEKTDYLPGGLLAEETKSDHWLNPPFKSFYYPHDYWFHPKDLIDALDCEHRNHTNCQVFENERVLDVDPVSSTLIVATGASRKTIKTDFCFFATGAELDIAQKFIPGCFELKLAPGWSYQAKTSSPSLPLAIKQDTMSYALFGDLLRFGSFAHQKTTPIQKLSEIQNTFKAQATLSKHEMLSGIRVKAKGNRPIVWKNGSLIFSTGLFKSGFSLSPVIAEEVLSMIHWTDERFNRKFAIDLGYNY